MSRNIIKLRKHEKCESVINSHVDPKNPVEIFLANFCI